LREEIRSGRAARERKLAVCSGAASLSPEDRAELLAILATDSDELVREKAGGALLSQPQAVILAALGRPDAAPQMFVYCVAEFLPRAGFAEVIARNHACPLDALRLAVRGLSVSAVQNLFEDLELLSTSPNLVAALLAFPVLTADQRNQLLELRREKPESTEAFLEAAKTAEPDRAKRETLLQKLSRLRVVERVQLALKGTRDERMMLIRDPCKVVQRAVLQSPQLADREIEGYASMASLSDEVLRLIGSNRKYLKNYTVVRALITNPKTPLEITLHLLPTITAQDLKLLTTNRNIPETLRTAANRLQRQRASDRGPS
jgi:hypothetical protein